MFSLKKVEIRNVLGDINNPRILSDDRFKLLRLSLSKFGLLSPLFITRTGKLLSGHQRTKTLKAMGEKYIYCAVVADLPKSATNAVNFAFNKELQEIVSNEETEVDVKEKQDQLLEYLESLDDVEDKFYYLKKTTLIHKTEIIQTQLKDKKSQGNSALLYMKAKVIIPLILDENNNIINGNARYQYYSTMFDEIPCLVVKGITNDVFKYITANYSLKGKEDNIRLEQRRHQVANSLSGVYSNVLVGDVLADGSEAFRSKYMKTHYERILDFGAGNGKQTVFARHKGHDITLFEPFATAGEGLAFSLKETYHSLENTLKELTKEEPFNLVVANAVLNSVPFEADLKKVVTLLKFLSAGAKTLIVSSRNITSLRTNKDSSTATKISELGDKAFVSTGNKTKIQNFHTTNDIEKLFGKGGKFKTKAQYTFYRIDYPKYTISKQELLEAVDFEFGIRYNNRTFTDIRDRAMLVFSERYDSFLAKGLIDE